MLFEGILAFSPFSRRLSLECVRWKIALWYFSKRRFGNHYRHLNTKRAVACFPFYLPDGIVFFFSSLWYSYDVRTRTYQC